MRAARRTSTRSLLAKKPRRGSSEKRSSVDLRRINALRRTLLPWARREGRAFFWRAPGLKPYQALIIEILLTKTRAELVDRIARVVLARYPTPAALARARRRDLESMLYPLGLHRKRTAGLIACAHALLEQHGGQIPTTIEQLIRLPAVGRYAANAVASVVYGEHVAVLDANVSRVYQRMFSLPPPPERLANAHELWETAQRMLPRAKAKEFNWAILDLGGTVCTAKAPACTRCPVSANCDTYRRISR